MGNSAPNRVYANQKRLTRELLRLFFFFFTHRTIDVLSAHDSRVRFRRDAVSPVERNGRVGLRRAVELHKVTLKNGLGLHGEIDERKVYEEKKKQI